MSEEIKQFFGLETANFFKESYMTLDLVKKACGIRKFPKALLALTVLFFGVLNVYALDGFSSFSSKLGGFLPSLEESSQMLLLQSTEKNGYLRYESLQNASTEQNRLVLHSTSDQGFTNFVFNTDGSLKEYESRSKPDASRGGRDGKNKNPTVYTKITQISGTNYSYINEKVDGSRQEKTFKLGKDEVLFINLPYIVQRSLKAGIHKSFNCDGYMNPDVKVNFDVQYLADTDPLKFASQYKYPQEFLDLLKKNPAAQVVQVSLTGVYGAFYPHKFYFIFDKAPDYYLRAFWGGEPGKDFFQIEKF